MKTKKILYLKSPKKNILGDFHKINSDFPQS